MNDTIKVCLREICHSNDRNSYGNRGRKATVERSLILTCHSSLIMGLLIKFLIKSPHNYVPLVICFLEVDP